MRTCRAHGSIRLAASVAAAEASIEKAQADLERIEERYADHGDDE